MRTPSPAAPATTIVLGAVLCGCSPATSQTDTSVPTEAAATAAADGVPASTVADSGLQADLALMTSWFAGRFDNHLQVAQQKAAGVEEPHEHIHSIFAPVELPAFGEHVYYVTQYMDGDPANTYRQRLYTFSADAAENAIVLRIFAFLDDAAYTDAHLAPHKLAGLTPDKTRPTPGCEVYWRRVEDHFVGATKEQACKIVSRRSGKTLIISDDLYLDQNQIWIHDRAVDTEGNPVFGRATPHKLQRARVFSGWAAVRKNAILNPAAQPAKSGDGKEDTSYMGVSIPMIHDQGQRMVLKDQAGRPLGYEVELAQLVYKSEVQTTPILKLALYEGDSKSSIVYTWSNPEAQRIGVNIGRVQVGLTFDSGATIPTPQSTEADAQPATASGPHGGGSPVLDRFARYLTGRFDSKDQADADEDYFAIQLHVCPVQAPEIGERVLYVEQAAMSALDKPYRQRLYVLEPVRGKDGASTANTVISRIFTLSDAKSAIGLCQRPGPHRYTAAEAEERVGCAVTMTWNGQRFAGSSDGNACPSNLRGSSYATVEVTLTDSLLESWDRGYDQSGKQVWGAEKGPYKFVRRQ